MVLVMALYNAGAFSFFAAMGISSFGAPPIVHVHAVIFFGWVVILAVQASLAAAGNRALHRRLGWLATGWVALMVAAGITVTVWNVREGRVPFIFAPAYFLVMNPLNVLTFAALTIAAVVKRCDTRWHRRLIIAGMAAIMGPSLGRSLPPPVLVAAGVPVVFGIECAIIGIGMLRDKLREGRVHPAWLVGLLGLIAMQAGIELLGHGAVADALYDAVVVGSPAQSVPGSVRPPFPG